jgi:hypothetical protein
MAYENRRYLIIPTTITGSINFNEVHETSVDTLRLNISGSQTFVKYEVTEVTASYTETYEDLETGTTGSRTVEAGIYGRPSIYSGSYSEYTHSEILSILTGSEWTSPMEEEV